jgi:amino acid transporter
VLALTLVGLWGVRESTAVTAVFTVIEAAGLALVVWAGTREGGLGDALATAPSFEMLAGASVVFFSFLGFENIVNLAAETKDPGRALPRAILVSLCTAIVLYVLVALAVVALVEPSVLAESDAPLTSAVRKTSPQLASVLSGVALFATANTALASILSGSRVLYGMSEEGQLPGVLGAVHSARKTPWVATLILAGIAGALLPLGSVGTVASVSSFAALIAFVLVNAAVIVLRRRKPKLERPFRVPLAVGGVPLPALLGAVLAAMLIARLPAIGLAIGAGLLAVLAIGRVLVLVLARAPH